jgi:hypothetical protein
MDEFAEHPSAFRLEAWHAGAEDAETAGHVAACEPCAVYVRSLEGSRDAFAQREADAFLRRVTAATPSPLSRTASPPRPRRWWVGVTLAAAAALMIVVLRPGSPGGESSTGDRLKGGTQLAAIVLRAGVQTRLTDPVRVKPGDAVRFELTLSEGGPVRVVLRPVGDAPIVLFDGQLGTGTNLVPESVQVDDRKQDAVLWAGPPEAIAAAERQPEAALPTGVSVLRILSTP